MKRYSLLEYKNKANNPWLEDYDNGWGPYKWPDGVPNHLLGSVRTLAGANVIIRKELIPLVSKLFYATEVVIGYPASTPTGGNTGGYNNRSVRGGTGPSTHSRARAIDIRSLDNPQSFSFICTIPPVAVDLWERAGFYWGGRYKGVPFDPMHFSYVYGPSVVPFHISVVDKFIRENEVDYEKLEAIVRRVVKDELDSREVKKRKVLDYSRYKGEIEPTERSLSARAIETDSYAFLTDISGRVNEISKHFKLHPDNR